MSIAMKRVHEQYKQLATDEEKTDLLIDRGLLDNSNSAWITPDGKVYKGISFGCHEHWLMAVFGLDVKDVENTWVRACSVRGQYYTESKRITSKQKRRLLDLGYKLDKEDE